MARFFMRFPGWKDLAVTLSYDDGVIQDRRLIEIMQKYGLKGTFNVNSGLYGEDRRMTKETAAALYKGNGMEVALHSETHPYLAAISNEMCSKEVLMDRINLERDFDTIVRGMSYPCNSYNDDVVATLKQCGIVYSRTTDATYAFGIPTDWLRWHPTCRHIDTNFMELAHRFVEEDKYNAPALFYLWGHSYEFDDDDNWEVIEAFAEYMGNRENIWYVTNMEFYEYVTAYRQLVFSMDESRVYNPTNKELYFETDDRKYCVKPGENRLDQ